MTPAFCWRRHSRAGRVKRGFHQLLQPLEQAMGGKVEVDAAGRFYLILDSGRMEMHLVAEGLRKLAMVARLIATGSLLDTGYLFWDEPEANLNPRAIKTVAKTILSVAQNGTRFSSRPTVCFCFASCISSSSESSPAWIRGVSDFG